MVLAAIAIVTTWASDFREVSFEAEDGGKIYGNLYGGGDHVVVLAHGRAFDKESWHELAAPMIAEGLKLLAIDFPVYGKRQQGTKGKTLELDVFVAIDYLKGEAAERVSLFGASMGGETIGRAMVQDKADGVDRVVLLTAAPPVDSPKNLKGNKLFVVSEGDFIAKSTREQFNEAPEPKRLKILPGDTHAQHIFKLDRAYVLTKLILDFLTE